MTFLIPTVLQSATIWEMPRHRRALGWPNSNQMQQLLGPICQARSTKEEKKETDVLNKGNDMGEVTMLKNMQLVYNEGQQVCLTEARLWYLKTPRRQALGGGGITWTWNASFLQWYILYIYNGVFEASALIWGQHSSFVESRYAKIPEDRTTEVARKRCVQKLTG